MYLHKFKYDFDLESYELVVNKLENQKKKKVL